MISRFQMKARAKISFLSGGADITNDAEISHVLPYYNKPPHFVKQRTIPILNKLRGNSYGKDTKTPSV
jgi:hypothetical protein